MVFAGVDNTLLQAANTYTGTTTLNSGTLTLDFSAATAPASGNILYNGVTPATFTMAGGNLVINGNAAVAETQTLGGLTLGGGGGTIVFNTDGRAPPSPWGASPVRSVERSTLRSAAAAQSPPARATTPSTASSAAMRPSTAPTGPQSPAPASERIPDTPTRTTPAPSEPTKTSPIPPARLLRQHLTSTMVGSIRFDNASAGTIAISSGITMTVGTGGLLVTPNVGSGNAQTITGGTITTPSGQDLIVQNFNTGSSLTISSVIGGNAGLTKSALARSSWAAPPTPSPATYTSTAARCRSPGPMATPRPGRWASSLAERRSSASC